MTEKQNEILEKLMRIPVMEYDLAGDLSRDVLVRLLLEYTRTYQKIMFLVGSPEISEETEQCLRKDMDQLKEKHQLVVSRLNQLRQEGAA